uniref:Putative RNA polymerase sigma facter n=1 Tax=Magnetococcus massalia (strain MO-1) TaxID=451514 RepID=A0A1S7LMR2_MAGMO|nr:putative RNA polymerase sigma facter [Candidatus Magnetococcus massalia]
MTLDHHIATPSRSDEISRDAALIAEIAAGDQDSARLLVQRHSKPLYGLAGRMLNASDAEDVVQEAFIRLWNQAKRWRAEAKIATWLHRVVYNLCIDHLRKKQGIDLDAIPEPTDPSQDLYAHHANQQLANRLDAALGQLPSRQRAAVTLVYHLGFSQLEAAQIMEIGVKALESLLSRARKTLRQSLKDLHNGSSS